MVHDNESVLRAIAVSSALFPSVTNSERSQAFQTLQEFKQQNDERVRISLEWLQTENISLQGIDISVPTKLIALEVCGEFLKISKKMRSPSYMEITDIDRVTFRQAICRSCRAICRVPSDGSRILANKFADIIVSMILHDFPHRWTTLAGDLFSPFQQGGLWYDCLEPNAGCFIGVKICLECLRLLTEDCTDSDFNTKIPAARRNEVLTGLNDISNQFLGLLYKNLEAHGTLQQASIQLYEMNSFLLSQNRLIGSMTPDEASQYESVDRFCTDVSLLIADTLDVLHKFCFYMPATWMINQSLCFIPPFLYLLREPKAEINVKAAACLEHIATRGKLSYEQWIGIVKEVPTYVQEANKAADTDEEFRSKHAAASQQSTTEALEYRLPFFIRLSCMIASTLSFYVSNNASCKSILADRNEDLAGFLVFIRLSVDLMQHPSGRVGAEQLNAWTNLLRDSQASKTQLFDEFLEAILTCFLIHIPRLRWEDIEDRTHPHSGLIEASYDDEQAYIAWNTDIRNRSSLLFKQAGSVTPVAGVTAICNRIHFLLDTFGSGEPRNFLNASTGQLTVKSDPVIQFEGVCLPLEWTLSGIPGWAMSAQVQDSCAEEDTSRRQRTWECVTLLLSRLCRALIEWDPPSMWLRVRRADLLAGLRFYWKHDPSTLLPAIDSLLRNMSQTSGNMQAGGYKFDEDIVQLKKRSGIALVTISKHIPTHLVPWLGPLSTKVGELLSSSDLIALNQTHLYEFLSCVASAVANANERIRFVRTVLAQSIDLLNSSDVLSSVNSTSGLLDAFGVSASLTDPNSVTETDNVRRVQQKFSALFTALNQLLSVGKRCRELSSRKTDSAVNADLVKQHHADHMYSIQDIALTDPFVPCWLEFFPTVLKVYKAIVSIWTTNCQAILLRHPVQRFVLAVSDEEVIGREQLSGSVVAGTNRKEMNLVPKWSGWCNELRNTSFQMIGLLASSKALFAKEMVAYYSDLISVVTDAESLLAMEHRHIIQLMKTLLLPLMLSCPPELYRRILSPILAPVVSHLRFRIEKTWNDTLPGDNSSKQAMVSSGCNTAADLATRGGDAWYSWYYGHGGLFLGDIDATATEATVEKYRVDLIRTFSDVFQCALALKGEWALVLVQIAKDEASPQSSSEPGNSLDNHGGLSNKAERSLSSDQTANLKRINSLCHFLLLENECIAGDLSFLMVRCLKYPDAYTCRRSAMLCHRLLEVCAAVPRYTNLIGQHMLSTVVENIALEPKWMIGVEWDMINVARDILCRLVFGQTLRFGGQGPGLQQPRGADGAYEQAKDLNEPLNGGGILCVPSNVPRQVLANIPGLSVATLQDFEARMLRKRSAKDQKDTIRELMRLAADEVASQSGPISNVAAASGILDRASAEESLLHVSR